MEFPKYLYINNWPHPPIANQARAHAFLPWFLQDNVRTVRVKGASLKATDRPIDAGGLPKA
jgi:hypothetical protein